MFAPSPSGHTCGWERLRVNDRAGLGSSLCPSFAGNGGKWFAHAVAVGAVRWLKARSLEERGQRSGQGLRPPPAWGSQHPSLELEG